MARGRWGTPRVSDQAVLDEMKRSENIHLEKLKKGAYTYQCKVCYRILFNDELIADGRRHRIYHKKCGFGSSSEVFILDASAEFDERLRRREPWAPMFN